MAFFRTATLFFLLPVLVLAGCTASDQDKSKEKPSSKVEKPSKSDINDIFALAESYGVEKPYKPKFKADQLTNYNDCIVQAKDALSQKAYREAQEFAERALTMKPDSAYAHYVKGKCLSATASGDDDEALKEMQRAVELGFENGDLYEYMAKVYDGRKEYRKAIEALTNAMRVDKTDRDYFRYRGALYAMVGEFEKAEPDFCVNIDMAEGEDQARAYSVRGQFYESQKRYKKALQDYNTAIKGLKRTTDSLRDRVRVLIKLKRYDQAFKDLNEIIARNPEDDDSVRIRGDILASKKQYKEAIRDYSKVIRRAPEFAYTSYLSRAKVYDLVGEKEKAQADRKQAKRIYEKPAEKALFKMKSRR